MKKNIKLFSIVTVVVFLLTIGITGCQRPAERPVPGEDNIGMDRNMGQGGIGNEGIGTEGEIGRNGDMFGNDNLNRDMDNNQMMERSRVIEERVERLNEVRDARVFVSGTTAVVGITMGRDIQGDMTTEARRKIEEAVRNADPAIENVSVTADPDLFQRITRVTDEVGRGTPLSGLGREMEEIIRRITPTM